MIPCQEHRVGNSVLFSLDPSQQPCKVGQAYREKRSQIGVDRRVLLSNEQKALRNNSEVLSFYSILAMESSSLAQLAPCLHHVCAHTWYKAVLSFGTHHAA